ncbi:MAG: hypothetical protein J1F22_07770 [Lachnospiraceae bacterium]|nr:hypothetical protein [Lachnospiraceae bacterium]
MMDRMMLQTAKESGYSPEKGKLSHENTMWQKVIREMEGLSDDMSELEQQAYEHKIEQKMRAGKKLTSKELNYLRTHNPELYKIAKRVEVSRKSLRAKLKNCKSKQDVHNVIQGQFCSLRAMKGDPAQKYMAAMVQREIRKFTKSSAYAKLPLNRKDAVKQKKKTLCETEREETEEEVYSKAVFFNKLQMQCDTLSKITSAVLAF